MSFLRAFDNLRFENLIRSIRKSFVASIGRFTNSLDFVRLWCSRTCCSTNSPITSARLTASEFRCWINPSRGNAFSQCQTKNGFAGFGFVRMVHRQECARTCRRGTMTTPTAGLAFIPNRGAKTVSRFGLSAAMVSPQGFARFREAADKTRQSP